MTAQALDERVNNLIATAKKEDPSIDGDLILRAYRYAQRMHGEQTRESGEPYIIHPIEVATILADMHMDQQTICAALLHDCIEDTKASYKDIADAFGEDVAQLVDGVTKLDGIEFRSKDQQKAESLRKMFFAMAKDIRVVIIKLADRLHNMRTLKFCEESKRLRTAKETLEVYAPLAHRLGIYTIKSELEDLSLRYIDPQGYYDLVDRISMRREERMAAIERIISTLKENIEKAGIHAEISGRPKHFYSIYRKMKQKELSFEQIYDLLAVRVLVDTTQDCYTVLGIAHTLWRPIPGRFKDYIAIPKANGYQSLHNTLVGEQGVPFEIQIRTFDMHRIAEYGVAAHWRYKEGGKGTHFDEQLSFLRQLVSLENELDDAQEFMDTLKRELFTDEVFVFTPKGDAVDLPAGSTPLDFAYRIHSAVGNKCVGAKVNQRIVTLDTKLQTGDIVEIITSSSSKGPNLDWLKIVKTTEARSKIRAALKASLRDQNILIGKDMVEKEMRHQGLEQGKLLKNEYFEKLLKRYSLKNVDDIYAAVGFGGLTAQQVVQRLADEYRKTAKPLAPLLPETPKVPQERPQKPKPQSDQAVFVRGEDGMLVRFAHCCSPVPGDDIVGYITRGRGVTVHRRDCVNLRDPSMEADRLVEVSWNTGAQTAFQAVIQLIAYDKDGVVASLTSMLADMKISLTAMTARKAKNKTALLTMTLEIKDTAQLDEVMKKFKKDPSVIEAYRTSA